MRMWEDRKTFNEAPRSTVRAFGVFNQSGQASLKRGTMSSSRDSEADSGTHPGSAARWLPRELAMLRDTGRIKVMPISK